VHNGAMAGFKSARVVALGVALLAAVAVAVAGCAAPGTRAPNDPPAPSASATPAPVATEGTGDGPPNAAENNAWKQRRELPAADRRAGEAAATRIRPALEDLRAKGSFAPDATRQVLLDLGYPAERIRVLPMRQPPGVVYALRIGEVGCVIGDVRPDRVLVQVTAVAAEYGCLEPFSH